MSESGIEVKPIEKKSLFGLGKTKYEFVPDKFYKLDINNDSYCMPNGIIKYLESLTPSDKLKNIQNSLGTIHYKTLSNNNKYKPSVKLQLPKSEKIDISGALFIKPTFYKNINIANWSVSWSPAIKVKLHNTQFKNFHDLINELLLVHDYKVPTLCKFLYTYTDGNFTYKFLFEISVITSDKIGFNIINRLSIHFENVTESQTGGYSKKRKHSIKRLTKKNKF